MEQELLLQSFTVSSVMIIHISNVVVIFIITIMSKLFDICVSSFESWPCHDAKLFSQFVRGLEKDKKNPLIRE